MNIALSAVILFILLAPPVIFYLAFSIGRHPKATLKFSLVEVFLATSIFSLVIHSIALNFAGNVRFDIVVSLLGGEIKNVTNKVSNVEFREYIKDFACYNVVLLLIFVLLGRIARYVVKRWVNHRNIPILRLYNRWWYLFSGYDLANREREAFDLVFVDVVVDTKDGSMIYSGYLTVFDCVEESLQRIYLSETVRREFKRIDGEKAQLVNEVGSDFEIPGDVFIIEYSNITSMNLTFVTLDEPVSEIEALPDVTEN